MKIAEQDKIDIVIAYEEGVSTEELAKIYGVSREAIRLQVCHLGKPYHKQFESIEQIYLAKAKQNIKEQAELVLVSKMKLLYDSGLTKYKIIQLYGNTAHHLMRKYKLDFGKDHRRDGFKVNLTFNGVTYKCDTVKQAAKISGYSASAISNALSNRYHLNNAEVSYAD